MFFRKKLKQQVIGSRLGSMAQDGSLVFLALGTITLLRRNQTGLFIPAKSLH